MVTAFAWVDWENKFRKQWNCYKQFQKSRCAATMAWNKALKRQEGNCSRTRFFIRHNPDEFSGHRGLWTNGECICSAWLWRSTFDMNVSELKWTKKDTCHRYRNRTYDLRTTRPMLCQPGCNSGPLFGISVHLFLRVLVSATRSHGDECGTLVCQKVSRTSITPFGLALFGSEQGKFRL